MCVSLFYVIDTGLTGFRGPDYGRSRRAMKESEGVIFRKSEVKLAGSTGVSFEPVYWYSVE